MNKSNYVDFINMALSKEFIEAVYGPEGSVLFIKMLITAAYCDENLTEKDTDELMNYSNTAMDSKLGERKYL